MVIFTCVYKIQTKWSKNASLQGETEQNIEGNEPFDCLKKGGVLDKGKNK